ncbi:hypothetical protein Fcan01_10480 [Folsomia candida]|uniref:Odorant receptor n=2 Tax=Folsomia candida TaxID=158441 RepID=A0A226E8Q3_FOLCA|nr:hypothetical protein Fcan01_10480 [Folsomia candida]
MEKPHERIALTYSSIFVPFYKLLKYLGVFPYSFEFHAVPENHAGRRPLSRVIYARTEIWAILHKIVIIFYTTNSIYQVFQLIWNLIFPSSDSSALLILATWSLASVLGLMVALKYWKDGDSIVKWMTDMNTLESDIYENYKSKGPTVSTIIQGHHAEYRRGIVSLISFVIIGSSAIAMRHFGDPNSPIFIYSVLPPHWALFGFSVAFHALVVAVELGFVIQFVMGILDFCRVVESCLTIISYRHDNNEEEKDAISSFSILLEMDEAAQYYKKLGKLIHDTNQLFGWMVATQLGGYSAMGCLVAFLPIYYWKASTTLTLSGYILLLVFMVFLFCRVFPNVGGLFDASKEFQLGWLRGVGYRRDALRVVGGEEGKYFKLVRLRLDTCVPFGIRCGRFFYIRTSTMLTFFSAMSTYLIIMLQFGNKFY